VVVKQKKRKRSANHYFHTTRYHISPPTTTSFRAEDFSGLFAYPPAFPGRSTNSTCSLRCHVTIFCGDPRMPAAERKGTHRRPHGIAPFKQDPIAHTRRSHIDFISHIDLARMPAERKGTHRSPHGTQGYPSTLQTLVDTRTLRFRFTVTLHCVRNGLWHKWPALAMPVSAAAMRARISGYPSLIRRTEMADSHRTAAVPAVPYARTK
jgi:hypothetical protein